MKEKLELYAYASDFQVAVDFESTTTQIDSDKKKQVPSTSSTLIRNVYLRPKTVEPSSTSLHQYETISQTTEVHGNVLNGRISLQEVQLALANAQSVVAEIPPGTGEISNPPEILPLVSVLDTGTLSGTDNAVVVVASVNSNNISNENSEVETADDQPILHDS